VILVDAGPLVALVDADDQYHEQCVSTLKSLQEPLATVWPPLTEAMYLLNDLPPAQEVGEEGGGAAAAWLGRFASHP